MIDIKELRKVIADCYWPTSPVAINEILDRLEAAEKSDAESIAMYRKARDERDDLRAKIEQLEIGKREISEAHNDVTRRLSALAGENTTLRAKIAEMERQEPVATVDANDEGYWAEILPDRSVRVGQKLYALPGAQPVSSIPVEAIGKMLADVMAVAVSNGANSVSMPDEYVEVAVWLQGECPTQPAPSVPEGFSREDLEAVADGLDGYEKTVNVGNVTGGGDDHLESTTAYAARFIRAMLATRKEK